MPVSRFVFGPALVLATTSLVSCGGAQSIAPQVPTSETQRMFPAADSVNYAVRYNFSGNGDGIKPYGRLVAVGSELYGTASSGGSVAPPCGSLGGCGTVFALSNSGTIRLVYSFQGGLDGATPEGTLTLYNGKLYGITALGGGRGCSVGLGCGTVFEVSPSGGERVLHRFVGGTDGASPSRGLLAWNGALYGTTLQGGGSGCYPLGCGTVFRIAGSYRVIYSFKGGTTDGGNPESSLIVLNGALYGTTSSGGSPDCSGGCGTVFAMSPTGKERVLYKFGGASGANPAAGLVALNSVLYGTTSSGGTGGCYCGTLYELSTSGGERVLHSFNDRSDGCCPFVAPIVVDGALYGTTNEGGSGGNGTVYKMTISGSESVLHSFGNGGGQPNELLYEKGAIYGTTAYGGVYGAGTVYELTP